MADLGPIMGRRLTVARRRSRDLRRRLHLGYLAVDLGVQSFPTLASLCGVKEMTLRKWHKDGGVPIDKADAIACKVGVHPGDIWPQWWDERMWT